MSIEDIIESGDYYFYGIRMDDADYKVGDNCNRSHQWWQDDPEDGSEYNEDMHAWDGGELNGTCAFKVTICNVDKIKAMAKKYFGYYPNMYLIGGDFAEDGNDNEEIIIDNAKVLALI